MRRAVWSTGRRNSNRERSRIHKDSWQPTDTFKSCSFPKISKCFLALVRHTLILRLSSMKPFAWERTVESSIMSRSPPYNHNFRNEREYLKGVNGSDLDGVELREGRVLGRDICKPHKTEQKRTWNVLIQFCLYEMALRAMSEPVKRSRYVYKEMMPMELGLEREGSRCWRTERMAIHGRGWNCIPLASSSFT